MKRVRLNLEHPTLRGLENDTVALLQQRALQNLGNREGSIRQVRFEMSRQILRNRMNRSIQFEAVRVGDRRWLNLDSGFASPAVPIFSFCSNHIAFAIG